MALGLVDWSCTAGSDKSGTTANSVATLDCIPSLFHNILVVAFLFAGGVAVILIIMSGIKFVTSGGDPKQVEAARKTMTWAIIGLIIVILSVLILSFISDFTGVKCITSFGFTNCN